MFPLKDNIPTRRFPILTVGLIAANVLVFVFFQEATFSLSGASVDQQRVVDYGAIAYEISNPGAECGLARGGPGGAQVLCEGMEGVRGEAPDQPPAWVTLFTSMFMHGGLLHLLGNMLFLWIFGNNVEDSMGRARFVAFYPGGRAGGAPRPDADRPRRRRADHRSERSGSRRARRPTRFSTRARVCSRS